MSHSFRVVPALLALALFGGCATYAPDREPVYEPSRPEAGYAQYGYVTGIRRASEDRDDWGRGAVIGGVVGAVVGNRVGRHVHGDDGQVAGTIAGAVGGAIIGNEIDRRRHEGDDRVRVTVELDRGGRRSFEFERIGDLRVGDRVRIVGGELYRL